jgi:methionyl-tRNA synthetase
MREASRILITAALPYANGPIHLGHLAGAYLPADIYARYQRLKGRQVLFVCGSDEHGVPITISAEKEGASPQHIVDRYHEQNRKAFGKFGMSFDVYGRTSAPLHHATALGFLLDFHRRGILRERKERQFFDPGAGMFLPDRYVEGTCPVCGNTDARGDQCEKCGSFLNPTDLLNPRSKISGSTPELRETVHLYFPLGNFQERLRAYISERNLRDGWKENVLQYCEGWFKDGLQDRAVTRDLSWGVRIPLPGYENKVIYVWFDAVLGYISASKEWAAAAGTPDAWKDFWQDEGTKYVAFIGKDNVVFHCIVFPAMLMAWNDGHQETFVLPENVPANEFLNFEGEKFSKSRGWGIDVQDFLGRYPADALRYYLATALPEFRDSDFYWRDFQAKYNNELADIVGNFVNRTLIFARRNFEGTVPLRGSLNERDTAMLGVVETTRVRAGEWFEHYRFREGLMEIMNLARAANKYFNDSEPWMTVTGDPERCRTTVNISLHLVHALSIFLDPIIPFTTARMRALINPQGAGGRTTWDEAGVFEPGDNRHLAPPDILFTKIEDGMIENELKQLGSVQNTVPAIPPKDTIGIDDFRKLDLRVATVISAEPVPKSDKLLKLQVDVGTERRQIIAGIARHYRPQDLIGKSIVVVFNLQPAKLMGQESQGMLLAANAADGKLVIVSPAGDISSGSEVR